MSGDGGGAGTPTGDEDHDAFLGFVDYARAALWSEEDDGEGEAQQERELDGGDREPRAPPWSWVVSRVLKTCAAYPSGVTPAILLSDLSQAWSELNKHGPPKKNAESLTALRRRRQRRKLPNTVTIDSIYEKNFLSTSSILEAVILDAYLIPGTKIYMLNLGDIWSSYTIDLYLHRRYYDLVNPDHGILKKGREIFLTGCCLRTALEGHGHPRLLPTEYLVVMLDEDQDEDALLLGAKFCSDSFSSILLNEFRNGSSYSFYARIESIGQLEAQVSFGSLQRKQLALVDNDGSKLKFLLWGEQVLLANLLSVGSMLAVDKPFVASATESNIETREEFCLEYGSATQLYVVPFIQHEEPVLLTSTQMKYEGLRSTCPSSLSQGLKISQVSLPLDYGGYIDFKNYPFRSYIVDLHGKMTGISIYGVVKNICREVDSINTIYSMTIEDITGAIVARLQFLRYWSLGRVNIGHTVYISGLTCSVTVRKQLEVIWLESNHGASFVNLSCLPAIPNSACLHKLSNLSHLSTEMSTTFICNVRLVQIGNSHVSSGLLHAICGHLVVDGSDGVSACSLCGTCEGEIIRCFYFTMILADESATVSAWCTGATASEMLQICPDDFFDLPEDEQAMYLYTLENEGFIVTLVNSVRHVDENFNTADQCSEPVWEVVRAQKCNE